MPIHRLTARKIAGLKAPGKYADGGNLYLQVSPSGGKSWCFRYMMEGRARQAGVGPCEVVSLDAARIRAGELRKLVFEGTDPLSLREGKRAGVKRITFAEAAATYIAAHKGGWSKSSLHSWTTTLATYAEPVLGKLDVAVITTEDVLRVLKPIWETKTDTAVKLRNRIESVLSAAKTAGAPIGDNPARWKGHLAHMLPKPSKVSTVEHHPAMPWDKAPAFMAKLRAMEGTAARALEFLILTAGRRSEVLEMEWSEICLGTEVWTVPAARMKARGEHRVPLCKRAVAILKELPREANNPFVFIGSKRGRPISETPLEAIMATEAPAVMHGFRSTFHDWASENDMASAEVIGACLAHKIADKVRAAYERGDKFVLRSKLHAEWCRYLD